MNRRTERALANCDLIIEVMQVTKKAVPELMRRNRFPARDGYPSSSFPGGSRGGGKSSSVESTALAKPAVDPVAGAIRDLLRLLDAVARDANGIENLRRIALANPLPLDTPCANCERALPIAGDNRCDTCYRHKRRTGQDRSAKEAM